MESSITGVHLHLTSCIDVFPRDYFFRPYELDYNV